MGSIFLFYYIIYFLFISLFTINLKNNYTSKEIQIEKIQNFIIISTITLCFFGFGLFGYDTENYYDFYDETNKLRNFSFSSYKKETLFYLLISICKSLNISYVGFRFINLLLDFILLYNAFIYFLPRKLLPFAFIIYFLFGGMNFSIDFIRNGKCLCLYLLALKYLDKKQYLKYIIFSVLAFYFHVTAAVMVLATFVYKITLKKKFMLFLVLIGIVLSVLGIGLGKILLLFQDKMPGQLGMLLNIYASNKWNSAHGLSIGMIERLVSFYIVYKYQDKLLEDYSFSKYFINLMYIYILICFYFIDFSIIYERLASLFKIGYWVLFPLIFNYQKSGKYKNYWYLTLFFYGLLKVYQNFNHIQYLPNKFILQNGF